MPVRGYNVFASYNDPKHFNDKDKLIAEIIESRGGVVTEYENGRIARRVRGYFKQSESENDTGWAQQAAEFCVKDLETRGFQACSCEVYELVGGTVTNVGKVEGIADTTVAGPIKRYGYNIFITTGSGCVDEARRIIEDCGGRVYDVEPAGDNCLTNLRGYFQALAGCELAEKAAVRCCERLDDVGFAPRLVEWPEGSTIIECEPGRVENVKVFDRALSREEIERDFAAQKADIDEIDRIATGAMFGIMLGDFLVGLTTEPHTDLTAEEVDQMVGQMQSTDEDEDDERADAEAVEAAMAERQNANFTATYGTGATGSCGGQCGCQPGSTGPDPNGPNPEHNPTDDFIAGIEHEAWSEGFDDGWDYGYDSGYEDAEIDMKQQVDEVVEAADNVVKSAERLVYSAELNDGTDERMEAFDKGFSAGYEAATAEGKNLADEIALARLEIEKVLASCQTDSDFVNAAPVLNELLLTVERLVTSANIPDYDRGFDDGVEYGMELADDIDDELDDGWQDAADDLDLDDWDDEEEDEEEDDDYEEGYDDGMEDGEEDGFNEGYYIGANEGVEQGRKDLLAELVADPQRALALYQLAIASVKAE